MKHTKKSVELSSKDAAKYQAARDIIAKVEGQLAEEEEMERDERPRRVLIRVMVGILLVLWIIVMTWVAIKSLKRTEHAGSHPNPTNRGALLT